MTYNELIELYKNPSNTADKTLLKVLHPAPLTNTEELKTILSNRFQYIGPGSWTEIIAEKKLKDLPH